MSFRDSCRGQCACTFAELPPLPPRSDAAAHRERSDWWDRQARAAWALASRSRCHLDRWYPLMRFHRAARRAEIDHRLRAEALLQARRPRAATPIVPESVAVPVAVPKPEPSMAERVGQARAARELSAA